MDDISRRIVKQAIGITDEDLEKLSTNMRRFLSNIPEKMRWKVIAEVTESKYCFAGLKPGDRFVFNYPTLNVGESTAAPCIFAIAPLVGRIGALADRVALGLDPNDSVYSINGNPEVSCMDVGVERGGLGEVWFRVYAERSG
jgi:hypothetical protein